MSIVDVAVSMHADRFGTMPTLADGRTSARETVVSPILGLVAVDVDVDPLSLL